MAFPKSKPRTTRKSAKSRARTRTAIEAEPSRALPPIYLPPQVQAALEDALIHGLGIVHISTTEAQRDERHAAEKAMTSRAESPWNVGQQALGKAPEPSKPVFDALDDVASAQSYAGALLERLAAKLESILASEPEKGVDGHAVTLPATALLQEIDRRYWEQRAFNERFERLLDRIRL